MKSCISLESSSSLCSEITFSCKIKPEGCPVEGMGWFPSFSFSLCVPPFSRADLPGQVHAGALWFKLCSPGWPGSWVPYPWYQPIICQMCTLGTPADSCGAVSPLPPMQECAEPSRISGGCMMLSSPHVCNQQLVGADRTSFCQVEVVFIYPQTQSRQKRVKHTCLLFCILPTFLRA